MAKSGCIVRVVNWDVYQHYKKDREPPWIKMHNSLLEDPVLAALPDATKAHLYGLWLLASRLKNTIPADSAFIARRINATTKVDLILLIRMGFLEWACGCLQHASNPLASIESNVAPRLPRDRVETETEESKNPAAVAAPPATNWNREAAEDYRAVYRSEPTKAFFGALKPIAQRYGWGRTRPALQAYMRETAIELLSIAKVLPVRIEGGNSLAGGGARASPSGKWTAVQPPAEEISAEAHAESLRRIAALRAAKAAGSGGT